MIASASWMAMIVRLRHLLAMFELASSMALIASASSADGEIASVSWMASADGDDCIGIVDG